MSQVHKKSFASQVDGVDPAKTAEKVVPQQHKLSDMVKDARKREKKSNFKNMRDKYKSKGFDARVDLQDKESVATYLNEEFQLYSTRMIELDERQQKAIGDAKQLRRRKQRQDKSEMRRRGEDAGFDKAHPVYDNTLLPKLTVD